MRLFLCEKPNPARDIARVLGLRKSSNGCIRGDGGDGVVVTWALGHMLAQAEPHEYNPEWERWSLESLPIVPPVWKMTVVSKKAGQYNAVKALLAQASEVVIATDADREGEVIARELLEACRYRGPVSRLWLSALDEASVRRALGQLRPGAQTAALYQAGLGRSRADWLVGMNLSRLYTLLARAGGYDGKLSVGRVQTPTLALVVRRDREIESFQPVAYFELIATLAVTAGRFRARWVPSGPTDAEGRCLDRRVAEAAAHRVRGQAGQIVRADTERKREAAPLLFSLSALQQEASHRFGLSAQCVLDVAQALYEKHKLTSYPRTDCQYLPDSQHAEAPAVLAALVQVDPALAPLVGAANPALRARAWNTAKVDASAHHAIVPTVAVADIGRLSPDERAIYDLIRRRYLAQFFPAYEYDETLVEAAVAGETFLASGRVERVAGWKAVLAPAAVATPAGRGRGTARPGGDTGDADEDGSAEAQQALPAMRAGELCRAEAAEVRACKTKPPARFTDGTLIAAMMSVAKLVSDPRLRAVLNETAGIGTEATRASIIRTLFDRNFVEKHGKKHLISTAAGRMLIDALPAEVCDPAMTALWEQALDEIAQGRGTLDAFMQRQVEWVRAVVARGTRQMASGKPAMAAAGPVHACPDCGQPMRRRQNDKGYFWGCSGYPECRTALP
ncbi:DNA topoisomerase III, partial [Thauera aminoaromatica]|uniref:DNA topoisomerase III n=1 Tax=Thauera aminoaromatica TaxID=164330 RepID=UPI0035ADEFC2